MIFKIRREDGSGRRAYCQVLGNGASFGGASGAGKYFWEGGSPGNNKRDWKDGVTMQGDTLGGRTKK